MQEYIKPRSADHCTLQPLIPHTLLWPVFTGGAVGRASLLKADQAVSGST